MKASLKSVVQSLAEELDTNSWAVVSSMLGVQ